MRTQRKAADRGGGQATSKRDYKHNHDCISARVPLPPAIARRYRAACRRWEQVARHVRTLRCLLDMEAE
jgi:hypothetical protein